MLNYEKKSIDNRAMSEIWKSFSDIEKSFLIMKLSEAKLPKQTFYRWLKGTKPQPRNISTLVSILRRMGIITNESLLFPNS